MLPFGIWNEEPDLGAKPRCSVWTRGASTLRPNACPLGEAEGMLWVLDRLLHPLPSSPCMNALSIPSVFHSQEDFINLFFLFSSQVKPLHFSAFCVMPFYFVPNSLLLLCFAFCSEPFPGIRPLRALGTQRDTLVPLLAPPLASRLEHRVRHREGHSQQSPVWMPCPA